MMHAAAPTPRRSPPPSHRGAVLGTVLALGLLLGLPTPADAQWKWRDKSGQINISDLPPPRDIPDKDVLSRPPVEARRAAAPQAAASAASAPGVSALRAPVDPELQARKRAAEQDAAARAKADEEKLAAARAENCRRARSQVATLESGQRLARVNDKGEREVIDEQTRADELRRAREIIASDCR